MNRIRPWLKITGFVLVLVWYFMRLIVGSLWAGKKNHKRGFRIRRKFCNAALKVFNINVDVYGSVDQPNGLFISNHRSMIDPLVELSLFDVYILSKSDVADYPLIGKGAKETGVFFVDRDNDQSRKAALQSIEKLLVAGKPTLVYPEGTTHSAELTSDFRKGAFEVAFNNQIPVVPLMIEYPDPSYYWTDLGLMEYFRHIFSRPGSHKVIVKIGNVITADSKEELMNKTKAAIDAMIVEARAIQAQNLKPTVAVN